MNISESDFCNREVKLGTNLQFVQAVQNIGLRSAQFQSDIYRAIYSLGVYGGKIKLMNCHQENNTNYLCMCSVVEYDPPHTQRKSVSR